MDLGAAASPGAGERSSSASRTLINLPLAIALFPVPVDVPRTQSKIARIHYRLVGAGCIQAYCAGRLERKSAYCTAFKFKPSSSNCLLLLVCSFHRRITHRQLYEESRRCSMPGSELVTESRSQRQADGQDPSSGPPLNKPAAAAWRYLYLKTAQSGARGLNNKRVVWVSASPPSPTVRIAHGLACTMCEPGRHG